MTSRIAVAFMPLLLCLAPAAAGARAGSGARQFGDARYAWDHGEYVTALDGFRSLLEGPAAAQWHDSVALVTGEKYRAVELTTDGARPSFSPDGRYASFETGSGSSRLTRIVRIDSGPSVSVVAELRGSGAAISARSRTVAWIQPAATNRSSLGARDLVSGAEIPVRGMEEWVPASVAFGLDDSTLYVVASGAASDRNEILELARTEQGLVLRGPVSSAPGFKSAPMHVQERYLVHPVTAGNPVRLPAGAAGLRAAASFAIVDLLADTTHVVRGTAATVSADGTTIAWLDRDGTATSIMVAPVAGGPAVVARKTTERIDAPALSPDGSRIAFQQMAVHDWELVVINRDGSGERRLTREIQHDLMPHWLNDSTILAVMGEGRHRRSYLYHAESGARTRLFHNNSVRTIAPEYDWVPAADGSRILIVAERDGNTVSADRGVYLMDLAATVDRRTLLARVDSNRAAEVALRERGDAAFRPIAATVAAITSAVDVARIYDYEKALFDLDSKHISQPGNARAIDYLAATYRSFGYEPLLQWFEPRGALGGRSANVIAILPGTRNPELVYVVSSHFDSRAEGPGADDNTSGTAALLEAARVLAAHPQPATIIFASFTAEESGLLGSREFVRRAIADSMKVVGALNNDMLGWANDARLDNTIRYSNPGIRDIQHAAARKFSEMITYDALYYKSTDAAAYYDAYGDIVGGIGSYPVLGNPHYHQSHDVLETINHRLVAEASRTTVATLMLLASSPSRLRGLTVTRGGGNATVTWTPSPEAGVRRYIVTWGPPERPDANRRVVAAPRIELTGLASGTVVRVRAVNDRGLEGWDWARATVPD